MEKYLKSERIKRHIAMVPEVELLRRPVRDDYTDAYKAGKEGKCWARYYSCPISVFKFMDWWFQLWEIFIINNLNWNKFCKKIRRKLYYELL